MGGSKKTETTSQNTTTAAPPSWTMPGIQDAAAKVTAALGQSSAVAPYTGDFVAAPNMDLVSRAVGGYTNAAQAVPGAVSQVQAGLDRLGSYQPLTTGHYSDGGAYDIAPAIQAAVNPIFKQLTQQTLPGLRSSAIDSGAYSGDRAMSVVPSNVISQAIADAQNTAATIGLQDYTQRQNRLLQGYQTDQTNALQAGQLNNDYAIKSATLLPDLVDEMMKLRTSQGDLYSAAGNAQTAADQAAINNQLQKYDYSIKSPYQGLDIASALLAQLSGNYGTTTSNGSSTQVQTTSGLGNVVGGVLGGLSTIASLPMGGGGTLLGSLFKK